jgi:hypothetical protein
MIIIHGERQYGKVDHVPGFFYVTTSFVHVWFVPLIPLKSSIIPVGAQLRRSSGPVAIGMSLKSVLIGWGRAILFLLLFRRMFLLADLATQYFSGRGRGAQATTTDFLWPICYTGLLAILLWLTYQLSGAGYKRALRLGARLGIPAEDIGTKFGRVPQETKGSYSLDSYVSD